VKPTISHILFVFCIAISSFANAAQHYWIGGGSNTRWSNAANWKDGLVPQVGEPELVVHFHSQFGPGLQSTLDIPNLVIKRITAITSYPGEVWTFSSINGAKLTLDSPYDNYISTAAVFDTSLEIVLAGTSTNRFHLESYQGRPAELTFAGRISGTGKLRVYSEEENITSVCTLSGSTPNTCTGRTEVEGLVRLQLGKIGGGAITGGLDVFAPVEGAVSGAYKVEERAASVLYLEDDQIGDTTTVRTEGFINLDGHDDVIGPLTLSLDAQIATKMMESPGTTGTLTLGGTVSCVERIVAGSYSASTAQPPALAGRVSLGTAQTVQSGRVFDITRPGGLVVNASLIQSGTTGVRKTGPEKLWLMSANSYLGETTVNGGALHAQHPNSLGTVAGGTTVNFSGELHLRASNLVIAGEPLTLNGGICRVVSGPGTPSVTWTGVVTLNAGLQQIAVPGGSSVSLTGTVTGPGTLVKEDPGTLEMSGSATNNYSGGTQVHAGLMRLNRLAVCVPGALGITAGTVLCQTSNAVAGMVTVQDSGLFDVSATSQSIGSLSGDGIARVQSGTLVLGAASSTFSGTLTGTAGQIIKSGAGTLTFTGDNSFSGATSVENGTLEVNGSYAGQITLGSLGTLCGTGAVGLVTVNGGEISPGPDAAPGVLSGGVTQFSPTSRLRVQLDGTAAGTGYDRYVTSGAVLNGCTLDLSLGFSSQPGAEFTILRKNSSGPIGGFFKSLPEGAIFSLGGADFRITYSGGDGNDVVLTQLTAPPQPAINGFTIVPKGQSGGGQTTMTGTAAPDTHYIVEACSDLISWDPIGSFDADTAGLFQFTDTDAANHTRRFYRIVLPSQN
jgi:fibronectin-binding autotransporter adhesin